MKTTALTILAALAAAPLFLDASGAARAEPNSVFVLSAFPQCKGPAVFSPYPAGAIGPVEAKQRDAWFSKLKPIAGAPCVSQADDGAVIFCAKLVCRKLNIDDVSF
jgi:hypothetical protein